MVSVTEGWSTYTCWKRLQGGGVQVGVGEQRVGWVQRKVKGGAFGRQGNQMQPTQGREEQW